MIALVLFLLISLISPTREIVAQKRNISALDSRLSTQKAKSAFYRSQVNNLKHPEYISELARDQFGLVKPGERSYVVIGAPKNPLPSAVYPVKKQTKKTFISKTWDSICDFLSSE